MSKPNFIKIHPAVLELKITLPGRRTDKHCQPYMRSFRTSRIKDALYIYIYMLTTVMTSGTSYHTPRNERSENAVHVTFLFRLSILFVRLDTPAEWRWSQQTLWPRLCLSPHLTGIMSRCRYQQSVCLSDSLAAGSMATTRGVVAVPCVKTNYVKLGILVLQLHLNNGKLKQVVTDLNSLHIFPFRNRRRIANN
jgi:hypothetical protein